MKHYIDLFNLITNFETLDNIYIYIYIHSFVSHYLYLNKIIYSTK